MRLVPKTMIAVSIAATGLLAAPVKAEQNSPAETAGSEVRQEFAEAFATLEAYSYHQRDRALERAEQMLLRLDREIEALENKLNDSWRVMSESARERASQSSQALRRSRDRLEAQYQALKQSSETAWDQLKDRFADAYRDLDDAWVNAERGESDTTESDQETYREL